MAARFDIKRVGHLGFASDCDQEVGVLKRGIRVKDGSRGSPVRSGSRGNPVRSDGCIELEADPKHVEALMGVFSIKPGKGAATPRVKPSDSELKSIAESPALEGAAATQYRSSVMRAAYLAVDRPDISEAVKALSQAMASPREGHMPQLKRLIRYLASHQRKAIAYYRQKPEDSPIDVKVNSDWAGDKKQSQKHGRDDAHAWQPSTEAQLDAADLNLAEFGRGRILRNCA